MQHQQWQRCCCVVSCPLFKPPEGSQSLVYVFFPLNLIRGCILFSKIDVTLLCWTKHIFWAGVWLTAVFHTRVWSFLILMMLSDVSGCFSRECFSLIVHLCVTITSQNSCTLRAKFSRQSGSHLHSYWSTRQMWFSGWMYMHMHTHMTGFQSFASLVSFPLTAGSRVFLGFPLENSVEFVVSSFQSASARSLARSISLCLRQHSNGCCMFTTNTPRLPHLPVASLRKSLGRG